MDVLGSLGNLAQSATGVDAHKVYQNLFNDHYTNLMKSFFSGGNLNKNFPVSDLLNKLNQSGAMQPYDQTAAMPQMAQGGMGEAQQNVNAGMQGGLGESQATHGLSLGSVLSVLGA